MPSDAQRISVVKMLCDKGFADYIFISHDIHSKHRLVSHYYFQSIIMVQRLLILQVKYGGHGYSHILQNIIPKMKDRGISDEDITKMTITSPGKWLTFS